MHWSIKGKWDIQNPGSLRMGFWLLILGIVIVLSWVQHGQSYDDPAEVWVRVGQQQQQIDDPNGLQRTCLAILSRYPDSNAALWAYQALIQKHILWRSPDLALALTDEMVLAKSYDFHLPQALLEIAKTWEKMKEYEQAQFLFQYILESFPNTPQSVDAVTNLCCTHILFRRYDQAELWIPILLEQIQSPRQCPRALWTIGKMYEKVWNYPRADSLYRTILEQYPDQPDSIWALQSLITLNLDRIKNSPAAWSATDQLIERWGSSLLYPQAAFVVAEAWNKAGWTDLAVTLFDSISTTHPRSGRALQAQKAKCLILLDLARIPELEQTVELCLRQFNEHPDLISEMCRIGSICWKQKQEQLAIRIFEAARISAPQNDRIWPMLHLCRLLVELDKTAELAGLMPDIYREHADNPALPQFSFQLGEACRSFRQFDWALGIFEFTETQWPQSVEAMDSRASRILIQIESAEIPDVQSPVLSEAVLESIHEMIAAYRDVPGLSKSVFRIGDGFYTRGFAEGNRTLPFNYGNWSRACQVWQIILDELPKNRSMTPQTLMYIARCRQQMGDTFLADRNHHTILNQYPDFFLAWNSLFWICGNLSRMDSQSAFPGDDLFAIRKQYYDVCLQRFPECGMYTNALFNLGTMFARHKQYDEGLRYWELYTQYMPSDRWDYVVVINHMAALNAHLKRWDTALNYCYYVLELAPDSNLAPRARSLIGYIQRTRSP